MATKKLSVILLGLLCLSNAVMAQGNALGKQIYGGSFTSPVVYKEYKVLGEGYRPPERQSFTAVKYQFSATEPMPDASGSSSGKSHNKTVARGGRFLEIVNDRISAGYKDGNGNIILPAIYDGINPLHPDLNFENFLLVEKSGKYGVFWAGDSKPTIPIMYDSIIPIGYSSMLVKLAGLNGLVSITKPGKSEVSIPVIYEDMGSLDGYAIWTKTNNKYGLTTNENNIILKQDYDEINEFSPQTVVVKQNGKTGLMNYKGKTVLPLVYESISKVTSGVAWIIEKGKWGLISQEGVILTAPQFDTVYQAVSGNIWINDLAVVNTGGKINYLNTKGQLLDYSAATANAAENYAKSHFFEDFSIKGGRYKWYVTKSMANIGGGVYNIDATSAGSSELTIPFPDEFAYGWDEDWELEMSVTNLGESTTSDYGFGWGRVGLNTVKVGKYGAYLPGSGMGHIDFKVKKGSNKIKFTCIKKTTSFYYNDKLLGTGKIDYQTEGKLWFNISNSGQVPNNVMYDDIKFTLLGK